MYIHGCCIGYIHHRYNTRHNNNYNICLYIYIYTHTQFSSSRTPYTYIIYIYTYTIDLQVQPPWHIFFYFLFIYFFIFWTPRNARLNKSSFRFWKPLVSEKRRGGCGVTYRFYTRTEFRARRLMAGPNALCTTRRWATVRFVYYIPNEQQPTEYNIT